MLQNIETQKSYWSLAGIPSEVIKIINDENISRLLDIFNEIYENGHIPEDWLHSTFVTLLKKKKKKASAIT